MSDLADALDELMAQHRRVGSPVPVYQRPGLAADDVRQQIAATVGVDPSRLSEAASLLDRLVLDDDFAEFLTLRAYSLLD